MKSKLGSTVESGVPRKLFLDPSDTADQRGGMLLNVESDSKHKLYYR